MNEENVLNELAVTAGVEMKPCNNSVDLTDSKRFEKLKLTDGQKMQISALMNVLPSAAATDILSKSMTVTFPDGISGTLMKLKNSPGYTSTIVDPETGHIVAQASLESIKPQTYALGAFTAMSCVTGQYFLSEINSKLNMMTLGLDKILEFLYGDKRAELMSEISFVRFAQQNYVSIMEHESQRMATLINLQKSRNVAVKDIEFYLSDLDSTMSFKESNLIDVVTSKDASDISSTVKKAVRIKNCLELSMQLYVLSDILEVFYSQNFDRSFLQYIEKEAASYIDKCEKRMISNFSALKQAIVGYRDKLFKKTHKEDLEKLEKQVASIVETLSTSNTSPMRELLHTALEQPVKKSSCYLDSNGDVYLERS